MDTQNTHNPQTDSHDFRGCKHFASLINNFSTAAAMAKEISEVIYFYTSLLESSDADYLKASEHARRLVTLHQLRGLFICSAMEKGEDITEDIYSMFYTDSLLTEKIEL